jgi:23S rRNA (pseudouridine1915-N3)-methyltransferase
MIKIICFGKIKEQYLKELINDYHKRISKYHKLEIIELKDNENIFKEEKELLSIYNKNEYNIVLDSHGQTYESIEFATHLNDLFNYNGTITFIIGGSNGLTDNLKNMANEIISFSSFTFPHGLFRGILLEQIYRGFKINNNETYHK